MSSIKARWKLQLIHKIHDHGEAVEGYLSKTTKIICECQIDKHDLNEVSINLKKLVFADGTRGEDMLKYVPKHEE